MHHSNPLRLRSSRFDLEIVKFFSEKTVYFIKTGVTKRDSYRFSSPFGENGKFLDQRVRRESWFYHLYTRNKTRPEFLTLLVDLKFSKNSEKEIILVLIAPGY